MRERYNIFVLAILATEKQQGVAKAWWVAAVRPGAGRLMVAARVVDSTRVAAATRLRLAGTLPVNKTRIQKKQRGTVCCTACPQICIRER